MDDATTFSRQGTRVVTIATRGTAARAAVDGMRKTHYEQDLAGMGFRTWDRYDADAETVHFICLADGVPVASLRSTRDDLAAVGEVASAFPDLESALPAGTAEYLYLSRQLVVPGFRGTGLAALITHVAAAWWTAHSSLDYVLAVSRESTLGNARALGGTVLAGPVSHGPGKVPFFLMGGQLSALAKQTGELLGQFGWSPSGNEYPYLCAGPAWYRE